jgi:hypothetical protein
MISNEIKARIIAPYVGVCNVCVKTKEKDTTVPLKYILLSLAVVENDGCDSMTVLVKPISSATDEHASEVAKLAGMSNIENSVVNGKEFLSSISSVMRNVLVYQYLQSKGYALPFLYYSVQDLVDNGIYKLV